MNVGASSADDGAHPHSAGPPSRDLLGTRQRPDLQRHRLQGQRRQGRARAPSDSRGQVSETDRGNQKIIAIFISTRINTIVKCRFLI